MTYYYKLIKNPKLIPNSEYNDDEPIDSVTNRAHECVRVVVNGVTGWYTHSGTIRTNDYSATKWERISEIAGFHLGTLGLGNGLDDSNIAEELVPLLMNKLPALVSNQDYGYFFKQLLDMVHCYNQGDFIILA